MEYIEQAFRIQFRYRVYFTEHLFSFSNTLFADFLYQEGQHMGSRPKVLFVVDEGIIAHHTELRQQIRTYFASFNEATLIPEILVVPGGEIAKNVEEHYQRIIEAIDTHGIDRHSYVAAIGGGAVLDMVGYAAAVAHRGIRHIRIPTTVLSQNDSGVGVKNGINYFGKKNFLGTFSPPAAVFNDYSFLPSLSDRQWYCGIAEAIKVALIKDAIFFDWIENNATALIQRDMQAMQTLVKRCAALHLEHIRSNDPFETGSSRPLDFGHWSAHKLEQLSDFEILHGEAVAIGIALDSMYSALSGRLPLPMAHRIIQVLQNTGLPVTHPLLLSGPSGNVLLQGLEEFREHLGGRLTIMLLNDIGRGEEVHEMDRKLISTAAQELQSYAVQQNNI